MNFQYPQPYLSNNSNQERLNHHLNYAPQQPQQSTYQTQQYNWQIAPQIDIVSNPQQQQQKYQQFSNVQQLIKNRPQSQQSQQKQSSYSYQESGGQNDFKFPQIGNNVVEHPLEQSHQAQNKFQWAINAGSGTRSYSPHNYYPQQNPHFQQAKQQINNLNLASIRQNGQQTQQQQQQQPKPPINPYLKFPNYETKQLIPTQPRGRANEAQPVNSQNSVIKPDEELFKCSAKNCTYSFIKKKSDTMTTMCSDCKKQIMIRYTSPEVTLRCSACSQPVVNTYIIGELCQECWKKKTKESQNKSTPFQKFMFSCKRSLDKEDPQKTKNLSSSASWTSNQLGSSNSVITPRSNWKDTQSSLVLEQQKVEQEKKQSVMKIKFFLRLRLILGWLLDIGKLLILLLLQLFLLPQQQQSSNSFEQSGGQNDYKFPQPQIGNNPLLRSPEQSNQEQKIFQRTTSSSPNNSLKENYNFQNSQQQSCNLNQPSISQQPQQPQYQQPKLLINPYSAQPNNENKELIPVLQRGRTQEMFSINSQNSVIKPDEELFKYQAQNCTDSFIKKNSDAKITVPSDCKKEIRTRFDSSGLIVRCSSCSQPIAHTFLTGKLCQECQRKKNQESQNKNPQFQKIMFSSKRLLSTEDRQKTNDLSSSVLWSSNQRGSSNPQQQYSIDQQQ